MKPLLTILATALLATSAHAGLTTFDFKDPKGVNNVTFTLETFVSKQEEFINEKKNLLTSKNLEVERAVDDLLLTILNYNLDPRIEKVKAD